VLYDYICMDAELLCDKECIICLDNKETEWLALECRHEYHKKCIHAWMHVRMICPICIRTIAPLHHEVIIEHIPESTHIVTRTCCSFRITSPVLSSVLFLLVSFILISIIIVVTHMT
jgi:hypothetical protein